MKSHSEREWGVRTPVFNSQTAGVAAIGFNLTAGRSFSSPRIVSATAFSLCDERIVRGPPGQRARRGNPTADFTSVETASRSRRTQASTRPRRRNQRRLKSFCRARKFNTTERQKGSPINDLIGISAIERNRTPSCHYDAFNRTLRRRFRRESVPSDNALGEFPAIFRSPCPSRTSSQGRP